MSTLIKGKHAVLEALKAGIALDRIAIQYDLKGQSDITPITSLARDNNIKVQWISKVAMERLNETHTQGVVAYAPLLSDTPLQTILIQPELYPIVVILDHIEDPHNMGAILRTCDTMGVTAVIYPKDRQCQINSTVIKASSGAAHHLQLIRVTNLSQAIDKLCDAGFWVYGTDDQAETDLADFKPATPMAIILGNEHRGLSPGLAKKTHGMIRIRLSGQVNSLNVSVAAGIMLYALREKCQL